MMLYVHYSLSSLVTDGNAVHVVHQQLSPGSADSCSDTMTEDGLVNYVSLLFAVYKDDESDFNRCLKLPAAPDHGNDHLYPSGSLSVIYHSADNGLEAPEDGDDWLPSEDQFATASDLSWEEDLNVVPCIDMIDADTVDEDSESEISVEEFDGQSVTSDEDMESQVETDSASEDGESEPDENGLAIPGLFHGQSIESATLAIIDFVQTRTNWINDTLPVVVRSPSMLM